MNAREIDHEIKTRSAMSGAPLAGRIRTAQHTKLWVASACLHPDGFRCPPRQRFASEGEKNDLKAFARLSTTKECQST
jgi:hypothetical protein